MTVYTIEQYSQDINNLKKEIEFVRKQLAEVESMIWAVDEQHKEYYHLIRVQMRNDTRYLTFCVIFNIMYLIWIVS